MPIEVEFMSLSDEVIVAIYEEMEGMDVVRARQTCRRMNAISTERSIWTGLIAREDYRLILEEPLDNYSTPELQKHVLRWISTELAWRSSRQPIVRVIEDNRIGNGGRILLEGGRWLLDFGENVWDSKENEGLTVFACDLDSSDINTHEIYQLDPQESYKIKYVVSQVDLNDKDLTFNIAVVSTDSDAIKIQVIRMKLQGRGFGATPVISSLSPPIKIERLSDIAPCIQGDLIMLKYDNFVQILNWRTATISTYETAFFDLPGDAFDVDKIRLLPGSKVLALELDDVGVYEFSDLQRQHPDNLIDEYLRFDLLWKAQIDTPAGVECSHTNISEPYRVGPATRLSLRVDDWICGIIVPDNGTSPSLFPLAAAPSLRHIHPSIVNLGITKLLFIAQHQNCHTVKKKDSEVKEMACTLTFSWPKTELDMAEWQPPIISCLHRDLKVYKHAALYDINVLDDLSGRIVTEFRKTSDLSEPGCQDEDNYIPWIITDFSAPQYLPDIR